MLTNAQLDGAGTPFDWPEAIGYGRAPFASFSAGAWECVAGPEGVAVGCFGWIDPDSGQVSNKLIAGALMGFVLPTANPYNMWERVTFRRGPPFPQMVIRPGVRCVVASVGDFRAKLPNGGQIGARVYADPATGLPYAQGAFILPSIDNLSISMDSASVTFDGAGYYIPTRWTLCQSGNAGASLRISQMVKPFN
jgi:hypothetical protein